MLVAVPGSELDELAGSVDDALAARSEFPPAVFIFIGRLLERLSDSFVLLHEQPHTVDHLVGEFVDLLMVVGLGDLRPGHADYLQGTVEALLVGYVHIHVRGLAPEVGLGVESRPERPHVGYEHDHIAGAHLRGLDVGRVVLLGEFLHVLPDALDMRFQEGPAVRLVLGIDIVHVGGERHLGVDDHLAPLVEVEDHVRAHDAPVLVLHRMPFRIAYDCLGVEMDAFSKSLG